MSRGKTRFNLSVLPILERVTRVARDGTFGHRMAVGTPATLDGFGLRSGAPCAVTVLPARPGEGILVRRVDVGAMPLVPATLAHAAPSRGGVTLVGPDGTGVGSLGHLLAALSGLGLSDAIVEVDGPEVPHMDGSALPFVDALLDASLQILPGPSNVVRVVRTVRVTGADGAWAELRPSSRRALRVQEPLPRTFLGTEAATFDHDVRRFMHDLAPSRAPAHDVAADASWRADALRHRLLDLMGEMALAGHQLLAECVVHKGGRDIARALLAALWDAPGTWATSPWGAPDDASREVAAAAE